MTAQVRLDHTDATIEINAQAVTEADRRAARLLERRLQGRSLDSGPGLS